jgi:hypothetical protein
MLNQTTYNVGNLAQFYGQTATQKLKLSSSFLTGFAKTE